ncbi:hypothetical protein QWY75_13040 [Pontixanthobacter aestiaquae]|uniref:Uncharacterized protein n=1 Tax=Pontixanthobacter aestiaquae TaxID=1509367 RepID=A0A844Z535_9SPHN|nr:hypothetical protein [Pontixanthobacter aestiaquae]MDN3647131.1 hypothetical protein [Pontixanthobacter aestiaquae]MXO81893.1 hypothetical protein [Pontixanthobacter aestiaquae]
MSRKPANAILALGSALLLSGCVVAAIPVVASGALLGREAIGTDQSEDRDGVVAVEDTAPAGPVSETPVSDTPAQAPPPLAMTDEPIVEVQMAEVPVEELPASQIAIPEEELAVVERPSANFIGPVEVEQGEAPSGVTVSAEETEFAAAAPLETATLPLARAEGPPTIPEPTRPAVTLQPTQPAGPTDFRAYDALYSYVDSQARRDPVQSPRQSAVLAAPGSLSPTRTDCSIRPPAVLIDLDPGDQTFDPSITPQANPALGQILASLRLQAIDIFWISKQPAIAAGAVRKSLVASGLDPRGNDALLLMRRADDRKQARRKELAETHCLLAIGGDTRADFDELYLYLKDKTAAQPLEELIGAGWFLTPLPLNAQTPQTGRQ